MLSKEEKQELLELSRSAGVRGDFQALRKNSIAFSRKAGFEDYVKFLSMCSVFINHKRKPFRSIKGKDFRI